MSLSTLLKIVSLISTLSCASSSGDVKVSYHGHKLFRVTPVTEEQLRHVMRVKEDFPGEVDYWLRTTNVNLSSDIMVSPDAAAEVSEHFKSRDIHHVTLIEDIGRALEDDEDVEEDDIGFFHFYRSAFQINIFFLHLANSYPQFTRLINIGTSFEGRPLQVLKISVRSDVTKPAIWVQGGAHAREQIGTAVVSYLAMQLSSHYFDDLAVRLLVNSFDWYFLPVLNPDGYEYAQTSDRLWRKTRSRHPDSQQCVGVDANRNWDIKWNGNNGSSSDPCSEIYAGPRPFSEPETRAVAAFMWRHLRGRMRLFVDFHSYSQRWLTPWGYTHRKPLNYEEQKSLAEIATSGLKNYNGTQYSIGTSGNLMYTVTGGARDWVFDILGASYSYVVELRDKGDFGFVLPKRFIIPTAEETWWGLKAMALEVLRRQTKDQ